MSVEKFFENAPAKTILAPMAGYTDPAFRKICHEYGVALTVTEMVSSKAIEMNNALTKTLLKRFDGDGPSFVQIFGHEPSVLAESVKIEEMQSFDGVDINMGCPVKKIVGNGDGSALLENPKLASKCISAVKLAAGDKPLSVKFRLGVSDSGGAVDFAKMCADSGADFITVHFRTRKQMYSGNADYSLLPQIVKCGIPVFANGDVTSRERYLSLLEQGAYGVAVGRGALGKPYIFSQMANLPFKFDVVKAVMNHVDMLASYLSDRVVNNEIKKHVAYYLKGMRGAKQTLIAVMQATCKEEIQTQLRNYFENNSEYGVICND